MAPHAKYFAIYDKPFWRKEGLSGSARSAHGPMVEIHDASMPDGKAALFGFLGVPASTRKNINDEELKTHCRAQLIRLFGKAAADPAIDVIKDWAQDPLTATAQDLRSSGGHGHRIETIPSTGIWQNHLTGIASEWSAQFPGYIAGAIDAATEGVQHYLTLNMSHQQVVN
jgi:monoamine oxidase